MWRALTAIIILTGTSPAQDRAGQQFSVYVPPRISVGVEDHAAGTLPSWTIESTSVSGLGLLVEQNSEQPQIPISWHTSNLAERVADRKDLLIVKSHGRSTLALDYERPSEPTTIVITFLAP